MRLHLEVEHLVLLHDHLALVVLLLNQHIEDLGCLDIAAGPLIHEVLELQETLEELAFVLVHVCFTNVELLLIRLSEESAL